MKNKILERTKAPNLTIQMIDRVIVWAKHLGADTSFRWTATDTKVMTALFDEIRRLNHDNYLIQRGQKTGYK
jgi:hypothetical protein